ncbi:MAG: XdhC family protein [Planctomycetaceae bacterium]
MIIECLNALIEAHQRKTPVVWTSLVETRGSTPQKAGATMLVFGEGSQVGTLGGGCVEAEVKRKALENLQSGKREIVTFQLDNDYGWDDGLICGGRMTMLIDPVLPDESPLNLLTLKHVDRRINRGSTSRKPFYWKINPTRMSCRRPDSL